MTVHDFKVSTASGDKVALADYKGKALLIVNIASKCGHTPQLEGLQKLQDEYGDKGFTVLGFPSNQFKNQTPESNEDFQEFCKINYGVTFPVFAKINVNGDKADPLYKFLTKEHDGIKAAAIDWNFAKFLVGPDGTVLLRYAPNITPDLVASDIDKVLAEAS